MTRRAPRTSRRRKARWPAVMGGIALLLVVAGTGVWGAKQISAWRLHWEAPWPVIRTVQLRGLSRLSADEVRAALPIHEGDHLSEGVLQASARRLSAHPRIAASTLSWVMPDTVIVQVQERQPVAVVREGGVPWYIDHDGALLGPAGVKPGPVGVELVGVSVAQLRAGSIEERRRARDGVVLLELMRRDGVQAAQVSVGGDGAAVAAFDGWRLRFRSGRAEEQWRRFWQVAGRIPSDARHPREVDLRFANSVVVKL